MKFLKICEKAKKFLLLITQKEDVEKKKIEKLRKRIDEMYALVASMVVNRPDDRPSSLQLQGQASVALTSVMLQLNVITTNTQRFESFVTVPPSSFFLSQ